MKIYVVGKVPFEDENRSGTSGFFDILEKDQQMVQLDLEFERMYLPVVCEKCGNPNLLISEDIYRDSSHERGMGDEYFYFPTFEGECSKCKNPLEAEVSFREYPEGAYSLPEIEHITNCKVVDDIGGLDALLKDTRSG